MALSESRSIRALLAVACGTAGGVAVLGLGGWLSSKRKRTVPSYLNLMYPQESTTGPGEAVDSTPVKDGFRMPAEWEPHEG